ncbi:MAG: hypothetical protein RLY16_553, partial [Bacteroidota bacterium]
TATTLRTKGTLYQGDADAGTITVQPNKWEAVGNVYASAIDWTKLQKSGGLSGTFYLWDPKAGNNTVLGAYQTFSPLSGIAQGGYVPFLPGSFGSGTVSDPFVSNKLIESGQAFMVTAAGTAGSVTLVEAAKVAGNGRNVFRPSAPLNEIQQFKANLYSVSANGNTLVDGNLEVFDDGFAATVDGADAIKFPNSGENFGILNDNHKLVVDARPRVTIKDTLAFEIWNMNQQTYRLEFLPTAMNVPGLSATLQDNYLNTNTPISLAGEVVNHDFVIDANSASKDIHRFRIVFTQAPTAPLPVSFISLSANHTGAAIKVDWKVAGERGISRYEVERSADGRTFGSIGNVTATGNNVSRDLDYTWLDATPLSGTSFYRVKSIGNAGEVKYTNIVRVQIGNVKPAYTISPNPVEGSTVNVQFKNQPKGRYNLNLVTNDGRTIFTTIAEHVGGNSTQIINLPSVIARGAYQLEIIAPDNTKQVQTLFINTTK